MLLSFHQCKEWWHVTANASGDARKCYVYGACAESGTGRTGYANGFDVIMIVRAIMLLCYHASNPFIADLDNTAMS